MAVSDQSSWVVDNWVRVARQIEDACESVGRPADAVRLLPVSKTVSVDLIRELMSAGVTTFAENRVQEMTRKALELGDEARWVMIGALQRNKAVPTCRVTAEVQTVDSLPLAEALERACARIRPDSRLTVLVEVNSSGEQTKAGVRVDEVMGFTSDLRCLPHLDVRGLMTVAHPDPVLAEQCFRTMADLKARLQDRDGSGWQELSMGMSSDFTSAIAHGSTCVRVGTAIFGRRVA
ncbi:MAG: YggS family pyridoxal phosphate-dependent enzyme [Propionibacteriaceae bacterium]|nr:YggS family pyridoxal phosphate-dependent enzyme [Propionibacteriaceae bacterium]